MSERYDYYENVTNDVKEYIRQNKEYIRQNIALDDLAVNKSELQDYLYDILWDEDSVTGNASGSYFFSTWCAEEAIAHNWDLLREVADEWEINPLKRGAETADVAIRCYILGECISRALCEIEDEGESL